MRTIAVINQKGGVGKTTTVANLGAALARRGFRTCLIDLDAQSHLTLHLGLEPGEQEASVYDVLTRDVSVAAARVPVGDGLWVVPGEIALAGAEIELVNTVGREQILRDRLADAPPADDFVLIDCPPSLGLLTLNALAAADEVVIPLQPHFLALQGLGKLLETVALVQRRINPKVRVSGVILCMFERTTRLAGEVVADLEGFFQAARGTDCPWSETRIYRTPIRRNIKLAECPSHGTTIFTYEPACRGAEDYGALAVEFLAAHGHGDLPEAKSEAVPPQPVEETTPAPPEPEPCATYVSVERDASPAPPSEPSESPTAAPPAADDPRPTDADPMAREDRPAAGPRPQAAETDA